MSDSQAVVTAFTEMAAHYEQTVDRELRQFWGVGYKTFIGQLLDRMDLTHGGLTLDVATGRGVIPLSLLDRPEWTGRVVGLDITPEMLKGAAHKVGERKASERIRLVGGSGMQLPFCDDAFDTALCALATHHMDVPTLLAELHRVLRPGGQLLIADVALARYFRWRASKLVLRGLAYWYARKEGEARMRAEFAAIANMRAPQQWRDYLQEVGFAPVELTAVPARLPWYPPGILARATSTTARSEKP